MPSPRDAKRDRSARLACAVRTAPWFVVALLTLATLPWSFAASDADAPGEPGFHAPAASLLLAAPASTNPVQGIGTRLNLHSQAIHARPRCAAPRTTLRLAPATPPRHAQDWFARRNLEGG